MQMRNIFLASALVISAYVLAACAERAANSAPASAPTAAPTAIAPTRAVALNPPAPTAAGPDSSSAFEAQTVGGGSVTVKATPLALKRGAPLEFDIAMDTHSVDLADDMLKTVVLRDDTGTEYAPTAWDGPGGGGHHREGKLKFAALTTDTQSVTLIVRNIASVPERVFKWELPQ